MITSKTNLRVPRVVDEVCPFCAGSGETYHQLSIDFPLETRACDYCGGKGHGRFFREPPKKIASMDEIIAIVNQVKPGTFCIRVGEKNEGPGAA